MKKSILIISFSVSLSFSLVSFAADTSNVVSTILCPNYKTTCPQAPMTLAQAESCGWQVALNINPSVPLTCYQLPCKPTANSPYSCVYNSSASPWGTATLSHP